MKDTLKHLITGLAGFRSKIPLLVIESDDWGAVRMPSKQAHKELKDLGFNLELCGYAIYDSLESEEDLQALESCLQEVLERSEKMPVITANSIMANPDFEAILDLGYQSLKTYSLQESHQKYNGDLRGYEYFQSMISKGFLLPQLHGFTHVNSNYWLQHLREDFPDVRALFKSSVYGLSGHLSTCSRLSYFEALRATNKKDFEKQEEELKMAVDAFVVNFGMQSKTFIAPNYTWSPRHEKVLADLGIIGLQGAQAQRIPASDGTYQIERHYMGSPNQLGQRYLIRNSAFEPATRRNIDWKKKILKEAKIAFTIGAPLVISAHRVNFVGGLDKENRERNLGLFKEILLSLIERYPKMKFISSADLIDIILAKHE